MLLSDDEKLKILFQGGLEHLPAACVSMLQLAAAGAPKPTRTVRALQQLLDARLTSLLRLVALHLNARRTGAPPPAGQLSHHQAVHRLTTLCAALDRAPPLMVSGQRLSLREWLRERFELTVRAEPAARLDSTYR